MINRLDTDSFCWHRFRNDIQIKNLLYKIIVQINLQGNFCKYAADSQSNSSSVVAPENNTPCGKYKKSQVQQVRFLQVSSYSLAALTEAWYNGSSTSEIQELQPHRYMDAYAMLLQNQNAIAGFRLL